MEPQSSRVVSYLSEVQLVVQKQSKLQKVIGPMKSGTVSDMLLYDIHTYIYIQIDICLKMGGQGDWTYGPYQVPLLEIEISSLFSQDMCSLWSEIPIM